MTSKAVAERLGLGRDVRSDHQLIKAIREGFPSAALDTLFGEFAALSGVQVDIYQAVGKMRTLQRKRSEKLALSSDESDRLARLARLVVRAEEALGDRERAHRWLAKENRALGGRRPISLLDSDAGSLAVERVLGRLEHGVYS